MYKNYNKNFYARYSSYNDLATRVSSRPTFGLLQLDGHVYPNPNIVIREASQIESKQSRCQPIIDFRYINYFNYFVYLLWWTFFHDPFFIFDPYS
jgi:hypothetical protein